MPLNFTIAHLDEDENDDSQNAKPALLPLIWARTKVADHMRSLATPHQRRHGGFSDGKVEQLVTALGLDFSLMTQWTSFVAVSEKIVNQSPENADRYAGSAQSGQGCFKACLSRET